VQLLQLRTVFIFISNAARNRAACNLKFRNNGVYGKTRLRRKVKKFFSVGERRNRLKIRQQNVRKNNLLK